MMSRTTPNLLLVPCLCWCAACGHDLDAGQEVQEVPLEAGSCSTLTRGSIDVPASVDDCESLFLGRWVLCAADASAPDATFAEFLPQPDGIEFALENGAVRFYVLVPGDGGLVRSHVLAQQGTAVDAFVTGAACGLWMAPDSNPGDQTGWSLERFKNPDELLVDENASYVPAP
jgi:hypothetical protein